MYDYYSGIVTTYKQSTILQYPCISVVDNLSNILHFALCTLHHALALYFLENEQIWGYISSGFNPICHGETISCWCFYYTVFFIMAIKFYSILFICEKDCLCGLFQVPPNQLYSRYLLNVKMLKSEQNGHYFADDISESRKENNLSFDSCFIEGRGFLRFIPAKPIKYIGPSHAIYYIERNRVYVINLWIAIFKWLLIIF